MRKLQNSGFIWTLNQFYSTYRYFAKKETALLPFFTRPKKIFKSKSEFFQKKPPFCFCLVKRLKHPLTLGVSAIQKIMDSTLMSVIFDYFYMSSLTYKGVLGMLNPPSRVSFQIVHHIYICICTKLR